jgi:Ser/Thr protein kinase RdoA (MazF antagonist)
VDNPNVPYANLNPSLILDAIESVGVQCTGSLFALNSYENRVYQIGVEDNAPLIAKFYRPLRWSDQAIQEEHQFALELAAHEIPVVAPLVMANGETLHHYQGYRFTLFPRQSGRTIELDNSEHLEWIGRFIGRLHAVGACQSFQHRLEINPETYGHQPYQFLLQQQFIPAEIKANYCRTIEAILEKMTDIFSQFGPMRPIRLHGDCHAGNILWNNGPQIVDLDDCLMGPAIQDLWMLITGDTPQEIELQRNYIMRGYQEFYDFNWNEWQLVEVFRTLRMIHYSAWLAKRWEDPAFPPAFPWFNTPGYWQEQLEHLQDQLQILTQPEENLLLDEDE